MNRRVAVYLAWVTIALAATAGMLRLSPGVRPPQIPSVAGIDLEAPVGAKLDRLRMKVHEKIDSPAAWARLAKTFHAHGLIEQAVESYRQTVALDPDDYRWPYLAGLAEKSRDADAAFVWLSASVNLHPPIPAVFIATGDLQVARGEIAAAEDSYRHALSLEPRSVHARVGLAKIRFLQNMLPEALNLLEANLAMAHHHGESHALLAQTYQRLGHPEKARDQEFLAKAFWVSTRPDDPVLVAMEAEAVDSQSLAQRGARLVNRGSYLEAEALFRQVLTLHQDNAVDHINLGTALAGLSKVDEAVDAYERALELSPEDSKALNGMALALVKRGDLGGAETALRRCIAAHPGDPQAHYHLGRVLMMLGKPARAEPHYRDALALKATHREAIEHLGDALAAQDQRAAAAASWRRALWIEPRNVPLRYHLAKHLILWGAHTEVVETLRAGLELDADAYHLSTLLAWELASAPKDEIRDAAAAQRIATALYRRFPSDAAINHVLAATWAANGDFDKAREHALTALGLRGIDPDANDVPDSQRLALYRKRQAYRQPAETGELP